MRLLNFGIIVSAVFLLSSCATSGSAAKKPVLLADLEPYEIDSVGIGVSKVFSAEVEAKTATVLIVPRSNQVCLGFNIVPNNIRLYFDEPARSIFTASFTKYLDEYEAHSLRKNERKTASEYGKVPIFFKWGVFSYNAEADSTVSFGYTFVGDSPYFMLTIPSSKNRLYGESNVQESGKITVFLTIAQGKDLSSRFDQDTILASVAERSAAVKTSTPDTY
jgi:hypothetical protein